jgi:hypothetical protein
MLTKLEELVLIALLTGKDISLSSVYFPLERLVRKGYLRTLKGESTLRRGGMSQHWRLNIHSAGVEEKEIVILNLHLP